MMEYKFYIGSNNKTKRLERFKIQQIFNKRFMSFSMYEQIGFWKEQKEKSAVVSILLKNKIKKSDRNDLIEELKGELKQDSIGLSIAKTNSKFL